MGTIKQGVLGGFSGKVGTVVGSSWKGIAVMRGLTIAKRGKSTTAQLLQQAKFTLMIKFLQPLTDLLNLTFNSLAVGMSGLNKALSYNVQNAITGVYPALTVDYPITGKLGNVIGYIKDGKQMIRKLPKRTKRRRTRLQVMQQKSFL